MTQDMHLTTQYTHNNHTVIIVPTSVDYLHALFYFLLLLL